MTDFYQGKNVVVLGGAGFVGRHLCRALEERGAIVYVIDNLSRGGYETRVNAFSNWKCTDITDKYNFPYETDKVCPFAVFNLAAAVANVEYNQKHHNQMFLDNAQLQTIPVMICERLGVPHFLQVSSACVYGEDANAPAVENNLGGEPVGANAGYSWAKRMGERAIYWSNLQHAVIVRPSNIYGPGDWYDERAHVIPKLIKGYDQGTAKMFGATTRQFTYVEDAALGMIHALEYGADKEAYNLGGLEIISTARLHDLISTAFNVPPAGIEAVDAFDQGDQERFSDIGKLRQLGAGWSPKVDMNIGLKQTIEAYLATK